MQDYCGVLTEESIRKNFILIYELLDEMMVCRGTRRLFYPLKTGTLRSRCRAECLARSPLAWVQDYGYPQSTSTEMLKMYAHNEPIAVESLRGGVAKSKGTISSQAVQKPISLGITVGQVSMPPAGLQSLCANPPLSSSARRSMQSSSGKKNEIFVDILERLTVLFNSNVRAPTHTLPLCAVPDNAICVSVQGYILNSTIDGCIQMKSYLSGNPALKIALNEDLIVGKENAGG